MINNSNVLPWIPFNIINSNIVQFYRVISYLNYTVLSIYQFQGLAEPQISSIWTAFNAQQTSILMFNLEVQVY